MEVIIDGVVYVPKEKTELETMKEKYEVLEYRLKQKEEYPKFLSSENDGMVVKFITPKISICVFDNSKEMIGNIEEDDDNSVYIKDKGWETIPYNKEIGLYHKQPVWIKHYKDNNPIMIGFFDYYAKEHPSFIEPITLEQLKVMPFIWDLYKQLEG